MRAPVAFRAMAAPARQFAGRRTAVTAADALKAVMFDMDGKSDRVWCLRPLQSKDSGHSCLQAH